MLKPSDVLKKQYQEMIKAVIQEYGIEKEELSAFSLNVGCDADQNCKLLIIGRASNGWYKTIDPDSEEVITEFEDISWVNDEWEKWKLHRSAFQNFFWKLIGEIYPKNKESNNAKFYQNVAWTNLYKVAPSEGWNPGSKLSKIQKSFCIEILKEEINLLKPKLIVFATEGKTELDWSGEFIEYWQLKLTEKPMYLKAYGKYNESKVFITEHPQGRKQDVMLEEIFNALKTFD